MHTKDYIQYLSQFISSARWQKMQDVVKKRTRRITVVLECLTYSYNTSAVLRTSDCCGLQDVYFVSSKSAVSHTISKGADTWLDVHNNNAIEECYALLREKGYRIIATSPHVSPAWQPLTIPLDEPLALVFGTETCGLSEEGMKYADASIAIPMYGFTESFNISASAAICLHVVTERLRSSDVFWQLSKEEQEHILYSWLLKDVPGAQELITKFKE